MYKLNKWNCLENMATEDMEFLKVVKTSEMSKVSYVIYTPKGEDVKMPIVQMVVMEYPNELIPTVLTEEVVYKIALKAIVEMNKTGIVFSTPTKEDAEIVLKSVGISNLTFDI